MGFSLSWESSCKGLKRLSKLPDSLLICLSRSREYLSSCSCFPATAAPLALMMNLGILAAGGVLPPPVPDTTLSALATSGEVLDLGESGFELGLIRPPTAVFWADALSLAFCAGDCNMTIFGSLDILSSIHWALTESSSSLSVHCALRVLSP